MKCQDDAKASACQPISAGHSSWAKYADTFWAGLVQPRCHAVMQEVLCSDMARLSTVLDENALLTRELGRAQERSTRVLAEKSAEIARLVALHIRVQADNISKESLMAFLSEDLAAPKASNPTAHG